MQQPPVGRLVRREIHHKEGSELNVMTLTLSQGLVGSPHANKRRDEAIFIITGTVNIRIYGSSFDNNYKISTLSSEESGDKWILIEHNVIHQIECISSSAIIVETIGGKFFEGACINY